MTDIHSTARTNKQATDKKTKPEKGSIAVEVRRLRTQVRSGLFDDMAQCCNVSEIFSTDY